MSFSKHNFVLFFLVFRCVNFFGYVILCLYCSKKKVGKTFRELGHNVVSFKAEHS